jgi:thiol-disulfide isomerase/thioredoxin
MKLKLAPEWQTTDWLNTEAPLTLAGLRGRVVMVHAFQMLCPGCVSRGLPQAQRVAAAFAGAPLTVVGLHTVFEHHEAMQLPSLRAFLHEYRVRFPVGVDAPGDDDHIPKTMRAYAMQGTPTTLLIDARGYLRRQVFGAHEDLLLGAELQALLMEAAAAGTDDDEAGTDTGATAGAGAASTAKHAPHSDGNCDDDGCSV